MHGLVEGNEFPLENALLVLLYGFLQVLRPQAHLLCAQWDDVCIAWSSAGGGVEAY
ncbi:hypothetical protein [Pseudomonas putida]|uniref:hypothetical protein n=1 Tax=Pseudomonas putida TaxID=303 RepID=UPI00162326D4|nr:hypothetical protein [Pseudomonas putida]QNG08731.1 hypothetical protein GPM17_09540 [Pseudomonas putida]